MIANTPNQSRLQNFYMICAWMFILLDISTANEPSDSESTNHKDVVCIFTLIHCIVIITINRKGEKRHEQS